MFVKKRIELVKEFDNKERAEGFAAGLEFSGTRDFRVKDIRKQDGKILLVLEKLERSKV